MTADFDEVYWMLDTGFRPMVVDSHQFYVYAYNHHCFCITKLGQNDRRDKATDQYRCSLRKSVHSTDVVCSDPYNINSLKDWITATGVTPKQAMISVINLTLSDFTLKNQSDLKRLKLTLNPVIKFILDCISYLTHKS